MEQQKKAFMVMDWEWDVHKGSSSLLVVVGVHHQQFRVEHSLCRASAIKCVRLSGPPTTIEV
jgi:hypothetical protein